MAITADAGQSTGLHSATPAGAGQDPWQPRTIYVDSDMVLLAAHQGQRGIELGMQADVVESIDRLGLVAHEIVILLYPQHDSSRRIPDASRLRVLRDGLGPDRDGLVVMACPHDDGACDCAKPGSGLIELAMTVHDLPRQHGWFIGADQEGVFSARTAGLSTIRIGPLGTDHLSTVHRPDYEARDLLDAANHILMRELA